MKIKLEFGGGAELLVGGDKKMEIELPTAAEKTWTIKCLLDHMLTAGIIRERPELFIQNGTVRPGILVLVNDTDWELAGELAYQIESNDTIAFISTLHGG